MRFLRIQMVGRINEQGVAHVLVTHGLFHERYQQVAATFSGQTQPGGVVCWVVEPGHDGPLLAGHRFELVNK